MDRYQIIEILDVLVKALVVVCLVGLAIVLWHMSLHPATLPVFPCEPTPVARVP